MKAQLQNILGILMIMLLTLVPTDINAQRKQHPKGKKGGPPAWAPAHGYRAQKARYVYTPQYNVYYDRHREVYIYLNMGKWEIAARLPLLLRRVDYYNAQHVEIHMVSDAPYVYNARHINRYRKYAKRRYFAQTYQSRRYRNRSCD